MSLTLRRTRTTDPARDAELPLMVDVEALHTLLHQRGEVDLAAALLLRLTPAGAGDLAALLARFRRRYSRPSLFRSYTRLLDPEGARQVDLAVAFLRGAGHAGCRVYPDLQAGADETPVASERPCPLYPLPRNDDGASERDPEGNGEDTDASGGTARERLPQGIMPSWLPRPRGSSWDQ